MTERWSEDRMAKIYKLAREVKEKEGLFFAGLEDETTVVVCARAIANENHTVKVGIDENVFENLKGKVSDWRCFRSDLLDEFCLERINIKDFYRFAFRRST